MSDPLTSLAQQWAQELPREFARQLADALRSGPDAVRALQTTAALPVSSAAAHIARRHVDVGEGDYLSGALTAVLEMQAASPEVTPVWTGPEAVPPGGRLTLAVLADLIGEAQRSILLVSYATFPSLEVRSALARAVENGVKLTTLLERHSDNPAFTGPDDPFPELTTLQLIWPSRARPQGAAMHAKVLVVDDEIALVGSGNLTGAAIERNLECGLLIRGGPLPAALRNHFLTLEGLERLS